MLYRLSASHVLRISCFWVTVMLLGCSGFVPSEGDMSPGGTDPEMGGRPSAKAGSGGGSGGPSGPSGSGAGGAAGPRGATDAATSGGGGPGGGRPGVDPTGGGLDALSPVDAVASVDAVQICGPTGGGPYWVEEGATVTATVKCATGRAAPAGSFTLGALPKGATYDDATGTLTWKTTLDQAAVYLIPITGKTWNEVGLLKIGVAEKLDDPANVPIKDPVTYTEEFGLPVFHLTFGPDVDKNLDIMKKQQVALDADSCKLQCGPDLQSAMTVVYRGKTYKAEGHYRGASTLWSPQHNYTLRFAKDDKFSEPIMAGGRMTKRRRVAIIQTLDDNSYLRNRMAFELWNRMDPNIIRIEHFSAVVYANGKYVGLFEVSDKIDDDMMKRAGQAEAGNLYMGINHNAGFSPTVKIESGPMMGTAGARACPFVGFAKKEGMPESCDGLKPVPTAFEDLSTFVDFVAKSDDTKFRAGLGTVFNVNDYTSWWIHATALVAGDNYGKNAMHYHDPVTNGPWRTVVWDYNATLGQQYDSKRSLPTEDPMKNINYLWKRMLADSTQGPLMKARYAAVLKNEMKVETVLAAFDAFVKEITPSAGRNERLWGATYKTLYGSTSNAKRTDLTTFATEIPYMRSWIQMRWAFLRTLFP